PETIPTEPPTTLHLVTVPPTTLHLHLTTIPTTSALMSKTPTKKAKKHMSTALIELPTTALVAVSLTPIYKTSTGGAETPDTTRTKVEATNDDSEV
ncbi:MAG: hypothetical protein VX100_04965, partial [Pseudomonadota bacterium]|nr:hypothetical protein [Pseudomonadota bacterium]